MPTRRKSHLPTKLIREWVLPPAVTLGSSVRAKGILLEVRTRLPPAAKKLVQVEARSLVLRVPDNDKDEHDVLSLLVSRTLEGIERLPVIPREAEDILAISSAERRRWLKDGRLHSAGTRTVKLRGRARKITFHVFDPRHIEDVLDRDLPAVWRGEDAVTAAENRQRAAGRAALTRARKSRRRIDESGAGDPSPGYTRPRLKGWDEFDIDGLLR